MKNKRQIGKIMICAVLGIIFLGAAKMQAEPRYAAQMTYNPKWFHSVSGKGQDYFKERLRKIESLGYNTVFLTINGSSIRFSEPGVFTTSRSGDNSGFTEAEFKEIIEYAFDHGLEPVIHVHLASKIYKMVKPLTEGSSAPHPDLVDGITRKTQDPYYMFDASTNMTQGIYGPILDFIVASYPATTGARRCKYINVGGDEFDTDAMHDFGKAAGYGNWVAAPKAWAKVINDITWRARRHNVKVILWSDKFLTSELGKDSHGVWGWTPDARFLDPQWKGNAMNAAKNPYYEPGFKDSKFSTHKAVNYIAASNKAHIIIADWHYSDYNAIQTRPWKWEYPSVDYFQDRGFEVWITSFNTQFDAFTGDYRTARITYNNARMFAKYGRSKNVGGYVASVWYMDWPWGKPYYNSDVILEDSILFMKNPSGMRTLSQFSMEKYSDAGWVEEAGNGYKSVILSGGAVEPPPLPSGQAPVEIPVEIPVENPVDYLELKVESGGKRVGLIDANPNAKIHPSYFDIEVRSSMVLDSGMSNNSKVRLYLTGNKNAIFTSYLIFQIEQRGNGLNFKVLQRTGAGMANNKLLDYNLGNLNIAAGDALNVRIRDNKIVKMDLVDKSENSTYDILAKSGWGGAISSPKAQFPNGAYTMVQFISPSGSGPMASVKIAKIATEARWWWGD